MSPPRSRSAPPSSSSSPSSSTSSSSGPRCPGELPALRARRLDLSRRSLRRGEEPEPDPPRRLPRHRPVVHLRPAPRDRLRQPRHGPDLRGRAEGNPRRRPRRAGADADRRRGQRHGRFAAPRARHPDAAARRHDRSGRAHRDARLMDVLVPLPVAIPLVAPAFLTATGHFLGRRADDLVGIATAAAVTVISTLLILRSLDHDLVYWFGGWTPRHLIALGVALDVEPLSAGLAALAGALMTARFVFAWRCFDEVGTLFHVLMLIFLSAMSGFALSGDLFNMFVFFELMSVCAFALVGYAIEHRAPLQGAINFAVTNTVGALLLLFGIGLVYGRTGALNLAQIGRALHGPPDGLLAVAFALLFAGFLVKAGAVPFHLWLSDAYAVAPIPVCVVLSGVMSDLGLHAIARIYWPAFSGVFAAHTDDLRAILVGAGVLTALVGGTMAFFQRDLKRLLAFVTIGHVGIFLAGIGLLTARALAGTTLYVIADGFVKGGLFLGVGILLRRARHGDELRLRGEGGAAPMGGVIFFGGGDRAARRSPDLPGPGRRGRSLVVARAFRSRGGAGAHAGAGEPGAPVWSGACLAGGGARSRVHARPGRTRDAVGAGARRPARPQRGGARRGRAGSREPAGLPSRCRSIRLRRGLDGGRLRVRALRFVPEAPASAPAAGGRAARPPPRRSPEGPAQRGRLGF